MCDLTHSEELALVRSLRDRGVLVDAREVRCLARSAAGLRVKQVGFGIDSFAQERVSGAEYAIRLAIANSSSRPLAPMRVELDFPWDHRGARLLEDPHLSRPRKELYAFPSGELHPYDRADVINHQLKRSRPIAPRDEVEGMLLALADDPIPESYAEGSTLEVQVTVFDQRGEFHRQRAKLVVYRRVARRKPHEYRSRLNLAGARAQAAPAESGPASSETAPTEQPARVVECSQ